MMQEKKKTYRLMRSDDLEFVGNVELSETDFHWLGKIGKLKSLAIILFLGLIATIFSTAYVHIKTMRELSENYESEICRVELERDSCISVILGKENDTRFHDVFVRTISETHCEKPTHDNIWMFILECDPWYPDIIMAQAVQESSCGKSNVAKRCNNLFGMTKPSKRKLRCDINRGNKKEIYAEYNSWKMSVIDRIFWEKWVFRNKAGKPTREEYLKAIGKVYNTETSDYVDKLHITSKKYQTHY